MQPTFWYSGPFKQPLPLGVVGARVERSAVGARVERSAGRCREHVAGFLPELRSLQPLALLLLLVLLEQCHQLLGQTVPCFPPWTSYRLSPCVAVPVAGSVRRTCDRTVRRIRASAGHSVEAGEQIKWLPRRLASSISLPGNDFWIFDNSTVVFTIFTGEGNVLERQLTTDPAVVALASGSSQQWVNATRGLQLGSGSSISTPYILIRHPLNWLSPSAAR